MVEVKNQKLSKTSMKSMVACKSSLKPVRVGRFRKNFSVLTPESRLFGLSPLSVPIAVPSPRCALWRSNRNWAHEIWAGPALHPWMASFAARITRYHQPHPWMPAQNRPQMVAKPVIIHIQAASSTYAVSIDMQLELKTGTDQVRFKWYPIFRIPCINHNNI